MTSRHSAQRVSDLLAQLQQGHLLSPAQVQQVSARWSQQTGDLSDLARFHQWLIAQKYVTEYQLAMVMQGRARRLLLGPFKLLDRVAEGRLAVVFKAANPQGRIVAIKVLPPARAKDPQVLARFQREALLACRLDHANIVRATEPGKDGAIHYLVLEYLEGQTLEQALKRLGKLPPALAVRIACHVLDGLQYLQEQGLVHRNLEPANLMLVGAVSGHEDAFSAVKILDITLGRSLLDDEAPEGEANPMRLTYLGQLVGATDYLAPEQLQDSHACDSRADIYSLGCILYQMLTGALPFAADTALGALIRHATEMPQPPRALVPDLPVALEAAVLRMLAKDAHERFPTPRLAAEALRQALACPAEPALKEPPPPKAAQAAPPPAQPVAPTAEALPDAKEDPAVPAPAEEAFQPLGDAPPPSLQPAPRHPTDYYLLLVGGLGVLVALALGWVLAHLVPLFWR